MKATLNLIFFSDSRTNFVTEFFGSNVAFRRLKLRFQRDWGPTLTTAARATT